MDNSKEIGGVQAFASRPGLAAQLLVLANGELLAQIYNTDTSGQVLPWSVAELPAEKLQALVESLQHLQEIAEQHKKGGVYA